MSGSYGLYFNEATGTWDTLANWTAEGYYNGNTPKIPTSDSSVYLLSSVQDLTISGTNDQASAIFASGSAATGNKIDITGTLNVSGVVSLSSFNLLVEHGAAFYGSQLDLVNSNMEIFGYASLSNGGGGTLSHAIVTVEAGGTLVTQELNGTSTDQLIVDGTLNLTGGGPGVGSSNTINAGGVVYMNAAEAVPWDVNGGTFVTDNAYQTATFDFTGTGGLVDLSNDSIYNSGVTINGFGAHDGLILGPVSSMDAVTTELVNGNTLELLQDSNIVGRIDDFTLAAGSSMADVKGTIEDGHYVVNFCFFPGTMLAAEQGEIAVEDIHAGTKLRTTDGRVLPVRWVGWSEVSMRFGNPMRSLPIRIRAGALAEGIPARDLVVSPDHAIFAEGVLMQAGALVNGVTILRERRVPQSFRYYHVELATHELLLAENCPAESFVDNVDRMHFHNWDERKTPRQPVQEMKFPRAKSARQVPAVVREAIAARMRLIAKPNAA